MLKKSVLLLKSQKDEGANDKYEDLLKSNGFKVCQVKTLIFDFKNIDWLKDKLLNSEKYAGIVFSSPRCVQAVCLAIEDNREVMDNWQAKYNYVVGEATYSEALEKTGLRCKGKEAGNAANLAKIILQCKDQLEKPLLFPHGNLKTDTLKNELGKEGVDIEGVLVYETIPNPGIEAEIKRATNDFSNIQEYIVFFSPSGVYSSLKFLKDIKDFSNAKVGDMILKIFIFASKMCFCS
ncbi:unnamed protein product [Acanthoscelides obtectus]|uniref:Uroporphyrinogen-III synthase n=1 Tax=Acanthoscelides obtectus TaxID=200917 RepID=A0A9P0Q0V4_ACAOB|nr:unnamed protein product [Acanthoscelides obtectus]CAK1644989.1 Uroporphyrinogen-III synthase [Acanthoscelides obtectus]